jgi:probable F420-dependent oxidoreductase
MDVRFGVSVIPSASGRSDPVAEARHAEELGFDLVTVWDHLHGERPSFETWTLLTWMAASTSRISLGTNVLGLPYRSPVVLAKMAESFDRLSGGRLVLGLGAGGSNREFAAFGLPVWSPREKVEALSEALDVIRGVWTEPSYSFEGKHFRTRAAGVEPKPTRRIPIWVGAYGPRMLALIGRVADGWIPSMAYLPPKEASARMQIIQRSAEGAGRDPKHITVAYNVSVRVGGGPPDDPDRMVAGPPDAVAEQLDQLVRMGFTCLNLWLSGDRGEQRERLAREVLPIVREMAS